MTKRSIWFSIRDSLWFVPLLFFLASVAFAVALIQVDVWVDASQSLRWPANLTAGPEGARQILSVIAGSVVTVAGVIFSITIVTLSLAANQYSPRVLRSFMRDKLSQIVLGVLVGTFVYSLLVLRTVRADTDFVPQLALWFGILMALVAIGSFIAFIHNTAVSIQAPEIIARIAGETLQALDAVRESSNEGGLAIDHEEEVQKHRWHAVPSRESGYVQDVDVEKLYETACEWQLALRVECPVGEFVVAGRPLVSVSGRALVDDDELTRHIQRQFGINSYRTIGQDPGFGIRQIVDIALKALSPSLNDTTTAIHCIDYLGVILHAALQSSARPHVHLEGNKLRLILPQAENEHLIDIAFNEIRQNAGANVAVVLRLLRLIRQLLEDTDQADLRDIILKHINLIIDDAHRHIASKPDRTTIADAAQKALNTPPQ
ncbi:MAG: DUF2254 domain-containing protein [Cellvibrionaceae bacterium]